MVNRKPDTFPWWKKWGSYLVDIPIEHRVSFFDNDLYLILRKGKFQLCTDRAVYSYEDRYYNFSILLEDLLNLNQLKDDRVLILGLGLGSIPQILENTTVSSWKMTAIEIDEAVCELASRYILPHLKSSIEIILADAEMFMSANSSQFDLICVDLFIEDGIPQQFKKPSFLNHCKHALSPGGLLIFNTPAFDDIDRKSSKAFFKEFKIVFPEAILMEVHRNYMILNNRHYMKDDKL